MLRALGSKPKNTFILEHLAQTLAALLVRLGPGEAARLRAEARQQILDTVKEIPGPGAEATRALRALALPEGSGDETVPAEASRRVLEAMGQVTNPTQLTTLVQELAALVPRLSPQEATRSAGAAVRRILRVAGTRADRSGGFPLALAVQLLAPWLSPEDAAETTRHVVEALAKTSDPTALSGLAYLVQLLVPRLGSGENRLADKASRTLLEALERTTNPDALRTLGGAMKRLAPRLPPQEAAQRAAALGRRLLTVMAGSEDYSTLATLTAEVWEGPPEHGHAEATRRFLEVVRKSAGDPSRLAPLAQRLALAPRLEPREAAEVVGLIVGAMDKPAPPHVPLALVQALLGLVSRLEPGEGEKRLGEVKQWVLRRLDRTADGFVASEVSYAVMALAPRLGPKEVAGWVRRLLRPFDTLVSDTQVHHSALEKLAWAVRDLAPRLGKEEALAATRAMLKAMGKRPGPWALEALGQALATLAPLLPPEEAERQKAETFRLIQAALGKASDDGHVYYLCKALEPLTSRTGPRRAVAGARALVGAMGRITSQHGLNQLARTLRMLAGPPGTESRRRVLLVTSAVTSAYGSQVFPAGLAALGEASRPLPGRFSEQQLVDLLKLPTCQRAGRRVLVEQLGRQCGRRFTDVWDFVAWARMHRPDLNLTSPPQPPAEGGVKSVR